MELYRLLFKPEACFSTKIESYTLFGAFCWGYKKLFGEEALLEILEKFKTDPPFLISSPVIFYNGFCYFPTPQMKDDFDEPKKEEDYKKQKKLKKLEWIPKNVLLDYLEGKIKSKKELLEKFFKDEKELEKTKKLIFLTNTLHNSINRLTWTTTGGTLYNVTSYYYHQFGTYILLRNKNFDIEILSKIFELVPLGGNKSIGWGRVKPIKNQIERDNELERYIFPNESNKFYSLSPSFIDAIYKLEESFYQISIFSGKIENFYERLTLPILKKRVIYLDSGAQIVVKKLKNIYGSLMGVLDAPSLIDKNTKYTIYQYGYAFPLYVK